MSNGDKPRKEQPKPTQTTDAQKKSTDKPQEKHASNLDVMIKLLDEPSGQHGSDQPKPTQTTDAQKKSNDKPQEKHPSDQNATIKLQDKPAGPSGSDKPEPKQATDASKETDRPDRKGDLVIIHLVYVGYDKPDKETREKTEKRIGDELEELEAKGGFRITLQAYYKAGKDYNPLQKKHLGPRDFVVYIVRGEEASKRNGALAKQIDALARQHVPDSPKVREGIEESKKTVFEAKHAGFTINSDQGNRSSVSFVRNYDDQGGNAEQKGRFGGEVVLHEWGHQLLDGHKIDNFHDLNGPEASHYRGSSKPGDSPSIMTRDNSIGNAERHFTDPEKQVMIQRMKSLPLRQ